MVKNNYVIVDRRLKDNVFPFTKDGITFLSKFDSSIYNGTKLELQSGIQNMRLVQIIGTTNESIAGNETTQPEINKEVREKAFHIEIRDVKILGFFVPV